MKTDPLERTPPRPSGRASVSRDALLAVGAGVLVLLATRSGRSPAATGRRAAVRQTPPRSTSHETRGRPRPSPPGAGPGASQKLYLGASALSFSVAADSSLEHFRGGFYNPAMYVAPAVSALTLLASGLSAARPEHRSRARRAVFGAATLTGLVGTGFHTYNVARREGGFRWLNLFYGAPLAAPMGIAFAGLFGLAASRVSRHGPHRTPPRLLGRPAGRVLGLGAAAGLLGTAAEAGLLHFRGAFQDPFMYVPVTVPPLAAVALATSALSSDGAGEGLARGLLWATAAAGVAGMGFHAYGIHRNMGGWRNWSQMIQQGPPLPAPPSFTGMALAGLAALELDQGDRHA